MSLSQIAHSVPYLVCVPLCSLCSSLHRLKRSSVFLSVTLSRMVPGLKHNTRGKASRSPRQYKSRSWTTGALVKALHLRAHGIRHNTAARAANISKSTLSRYWESMPTALKNGGTETTILEWYQQHESANLEENHRTLLTHIEEELLRDWCILAYQHFEPVGAEQIIAKAREIMRTQRGEEHAGTATLHYRYPNHMLIPI